MQDMPQKQRDSRKILRKLFGILRHRITPSTLIFSHLFNNYLFVENPKKQQNFCQSSYMLETQDIHEPSYMNGQLH